MIETGAIGSLMSGSGATVFGMYRSKEEAIKSQRMIKEKLQEVLTELCHTL